MTAIKADVEAVIRKAASQIGVTEVPFGSNRTPYTAWYGMVGPWCAMFVSWVFWHAGYKLPPITTEKGFAYCPSIVAWAKANGCWRPSSSDYVPKRGDIVLFDFIGRPSHVGIVDFLRADGRVATIEGNTNPAGSRTGGMVMRHNRSRRGSTIGYVDVTAIAGKPPAKPVRRKWLQVSPGIKDPDLAFFGGFDNQVAEVQLRLNAARFGPLEVDGVFGPKSQAAAKAWKDSWRDFQRYVGQTPWPDDDTPDIGPKAIAALRWATS